MDFWRSSSELSQTERELARNQYRMARVQYPDITKKNQAICLGHLYWLRRVSELLTVIIRPLSTYAVLNKYVFSVFNLCL